MSDITVLTDAIYLERKKMDIIRLISQVLVSLKIALQIYNFFLEIQQNFNSNTLMMINKF